MIEETVEKVKLADVVNKPLYSVYECFQLLGWEAENDIDDENGNTGKVTCTCGEEVEMGGVLFVSWVACEKCKKYMRDATGFTPVGDGVGAVTYPDPDKVEYPTDGKVWVVYGEVEDGTDNDH